MSRKVLRDVFSPDFWVHSEFEAKENIFWSVNEIHIHKPLQ
jgi:hypothetical protein